MNAWQSNPHGNHVLGDALAKPHTNVKALGDDIGQAGIDIDLDIDVGVLR